MTTERLTAEELVLLELLYADHKEVQKAVEECKRLRAAMKSILAGIDNVPRSSWSHHIAEIRAICWSTLADIPSPPLQPAPPAT